MSKIEDKSTKNRTSKKWVLHLYIAGNTPNCKLALENLRNFCQKELHNQYHIEVVDILRQPEMAEKNNIIAIPTVIKVKPQPRQYIIGDFSNYEAMLLKLGLKQKLTIS